MCGSATSLTNDAQAPLARELELLHRKDSTMSELLCHLEDRLGRYLSPAPPCDPCKEECEPCGESNLITELIQLGRNSGLQNNRVQLLIDRIVT